MRVSFVSSYALRQIRDGLTGRVHSMFASSLNIELSGNLVHAGSTNASLSCFGMQLAADDMEALLARLRVGDNVVVQSGCLRIYARTQVFDLDFEKACVIDTGVPCLNGFLPVGMDSVLMGELERLDVVAHIGLPWPDRSRAAICDLARFSVACLAVRLDVQSGEAMLRYQGAQRILAGAVSYLMGRGLGLTPSGDDVLMGFGTALRFLYGDDEKLVRPFFSEVDARLDGVTTAVSEAYLHAMVAGQANKDYLDLLRSIAQGEVVGLRRHVRRIFSFGSTSGADSLLGFAASFGCLF